MNLDEHINLLDSKNKKMYGSGHFAILCLLLAAIISVLLFYTEPLIAFGASGFVAFFLHYFYSQVAFKKLSARMTLLQTKIEKIGV